MARATAVVVGVGAEAGLGAAVCRRFAAGGHHVIVAGRTPQKIDRVAQRIHEDRGSAEAFPIDATDEAQVQRLFDRCMAPGDRPACAASPAMRTLPRPRPASG